MNYEQIAVCARLLALVDKLMANEEFIEIRLDKELMIGGANLRIKGKVVSCNIPTLPNFDVTMPQEFIDKVKDALPILKQKLQDAANEV